MHYHYIIMLSIGFVFVSVIFLLWMRDIIRESTFQGNHTKKVQNGLKVGFICFLISEWMLFFSFFWAYFHMALSPAVEIGCIWPPKGINPPTPWGIPLFNTAILIGSGSFVNTCHHAIRARLGNTAIITLSITVGLGVLFTLLQLFEYINMHFTIADSVYGSCFFMLTGLHGLHVIVGTIFLFIQLIRLRAYHFTNTHHLGFLFASWYWHFVDVIWILVWFIVYWWGT